MYQSASCEVRPSHYIPLRPPSRYIYYPGIFRHREDEENEGCEVDGLSLSLFLFSFATFLSLFLALTFLLPLSLSHSSIYIFTPSFSFSCTCWRRQERIRQRREGSACWIAEPRGVGARIKGAVRLEGAPNYDVTDRTRRDQVSRIQNGLLITESPLTRRSPIATVAVTYRSPFCESLSMRPRRNIYLVPVGRPTRRQCADTKRSAIIYIDGII